MSVQERKAGRQFTSLRKQRGTDRKGPWTAWEPTHCDLFLPSRPPHLKFPAPPQIVPPTGGRVFNTQGFGENTSYSNHSDQPGPSFPDLLWREVPGRPHKAQCSRVFCCNVQTLCLPKMVNHSHRPFDYAGNSRVIWYKIQIHIQYWDIQKYGIKWHLTTNTSRYIKFRFGEPWRMFMAVSEIAIINPTLLN